MNSKRNRSYPESLKDVKEYDIEALQHRVIETELVLSTYKEKDHDRTEILASSGIDNSIKPNSKKSCRDTAIRFINYILENAEEDRKRNDEIQKQSYAGFYFFMKWLCRSLFLLFFSTISSVAGKEAGCAIKDHDVCDITAIDLTQTSPHLLATFIGTIFGVFFGQWVGRIVWDRFSEKLLVCIRYVNNKSYLYFWCIFLYIILMSGFTIIFYLFIKISEKEVITVIISFVSSLILGLILGYRAFLKYKK